MPAIETSQSTLDNSAPKKAGRRVTIVGETAVGPDGDPWREGARRLARAAGATALTVFLRDERFHSASPWVDLSEEAAADAMRAHLDRAMAAA